MLVSKNKLGEDQTTKDNTTNEVHTSLTYPWGQQTFVYTKIMLAYAGHFTEPQICMQQCKQNSEKWEAITFFPEEILYQ
jgi:hypothetical protein